MVTKKQLMRTYKSWRRNKPTTHERTLQMKRCGKSVFLDRKNHFLYVIREHVSRVKVESCLHIFVQEK